MQRWALKHAAGAHQLRLGKLWITTYDRHLVIWYGHRRRVLVADWWWKRDA